MSFIEEYKIIAQKHGFEFGSELEDRMLILPSDSFLNSKYCFLSKGSIVYFASDYYSAKVGMTNTYSGVYLALDDKTRKFQAEVTKSFWFDFISGKKKVKTTNSYLDKHLAISTDSVEQLLKYVDVKIVDVYLELWAKYSPIKFVFGIDYIPMPSFNNKMVIGVEMNSWVLPQNFLSVYNELQVVLLKLAHRKV